MTTDCIADGNGNTPWPAQSRLALLAVAMGCALLAGNLPAQQASTESTRILIKPKAPLDSLIPTHALLRTEVLRTFARFGNLQIVRVPPGTLAQEVIDKFNRSGLVEYAEPDYQDFLLSETLPNDPSLGSLWGMRNAVDAEMDISATEAWTFRTDARSVVVAVIDTGIRYTHEDLAMNMWRNPDEIPGNMQDDDGNGVTDDVHGIKVVQGERSGDPWDLNHHGSHVAGTVGAVGNNGIGVVGVAWKTQLMACRVINISGSIRHADVIECIDYAISKGARIINYSAGGGPFSQAFRDAIRAAGNHGILFIAAAGNNAADNDATLFYPASYDLDNIVSVGATRRDETVASYSNYGLVSVDLFAPGGNSPLNPDGILSTWNSSDAAYDWNTGTSMAAPHVTGAFALMKAHFPNDSYFQLINRMFSTVDPLPAVAGKCQTGGRLNVHRALTSISSRPRNDNLANSYQMVIPSGKTGITNTANNVDASNEAGEPSHAGAVASKSVWWHWTAPSSGTVNVRTLGSTFNTRLAVYTGSSVSALTLVAGNAVTDGCSWNQVTFSATSGTTYRIAVDGYNGAVGSIKLIVDTSLSDTPALVAFDRVTLQRSGSQFTLKVLGPEDQSVALERLTAAKPTAWELTQADPYVIGSGGSITLTLSAPDAWTFYRFKIVTGSPHVHSCNAVGYVDLSIPAGNSMVANPVNALDNRVSAVLAGMPNGTTLAKWDEVNSQYFPTNAYTTAWSNPNMTLAPGEGAIINVPSAVTKSFVGEFMQGYLVTGVPSGLSLRSSKTPLAGPVASELGTAVFDGDIITRMASGIYTNYVYRNGLWSDHNGVQVGEPVIKIGESFWINKPTDWKQISSVWP